MTVASIHSRIENIAYGKLTDHAWIGLVRDGSAPADGRGSMGHRMTFRIPYCRSGEMQDSLYKMETSADMIKQDTGSLQISW